MGSFRTEGSNAPQIPRAQVPSGPKGPSPFGTQGSVLGLGFWLRAWACAARHTPLLKTNPLSVWSLRPRGLKREGSSPIKERVTSCLQNADEATWRAKSHTGELHTQRQVKRGLGFLLVDLHGAFVRRGASGVDSGFRSVLSSSRCARGGALASSQRRSRTGGCSRPLSEWKCAARVRYRAL